MFCVSDPEQMGKEGVKGATLRSGFETPEEAAGWIRNNVKQDAMAVGTSSCPLIEALKHGGQQYAT